MNRSMQEFELDHEEAARRDIDRAILQTRASQLAIAVENDDTGEERIEVALFELAGERYAILSEYIREIYPVREITPLPCTPALVLGIINVRGQILSVIDLHPLFDLVPAGQSPRDRVVIIGAPEGEHGEMVLGIMADLVLGVQSVACSSIQPLPSAAGGRRQEYVEGVTNDGLIVLDARRILDDERIIVHEEVI